MTSTIALLGHPVAHSISPRFQQAALNALSVDARYEAWDIDPADLPAALERLRGHSMLGANITIPHKEAVVRLVDRPDALVERMGAANTIVRHDGQLHATNTDITGIVNALAEAGVAAAGKRILLLGAGGAARAVVVAMRRAGAAHLTIANRTLDRARSVALLGGDELATAAVTLDDGDAELHAAAEAADVVINATPLGMAHGPGPEASPMPAAWFHRGQVAFDLVYVPEQTPFLAAADAAGAQAVGGLAMLIHQGAEAFRLWTGLQPPLDVMFAAARAALRERAS